MDAIRFDRLTRLLATSRSRRQTRRALLLSAPALIVVRDTSEAGPGCKNVGRKCKRSRQCCSGVCSGKSGRKRCKGHDNGGCQAGQGAGECPGNPTDPCVTSAGSNGFCRTTTGNAGYCAAGGACMSCRKDADCRIFCGPTAACLRCEDCDNPERTLCAGTFSCNFAP